MGKITIKELDDFFNTHYLNAEEFVLPEGIEKITDPKSGEMRILKAKVDDDGRIIISMPS